MITIEIETLTIVICAGGMQRGSAFYKMLLDTQGDIVMQMYGEIGQLVVLASNNNRHMIVIEPNKEIVGQMPAGHMHDKVVHKSLSGTS